MGSNVPVSSTRMWSTWSRLSIRVSPVFLNCKIDLPEKHLKSDGSSSGCVGKMVTVLVHRFSARVLTRNSWKICELSTAGFMSEVWGHLLKHSIRGSLGNSLEDTSTWESQWDPKEA
jgi:hypothetical protein